MDFGHGDLSFFGLQGLAFLDLLDLDGFRKDLVLFFSWILDFTFSTGCWILYVGYFKIKSKKLTDTDSNLLVFSELDLKKFNTWTVGLSWMI
ncbi:MAG TPA: hypothetical protein VJ111_03120 [Chitinophagaceae bacterium]|nr:hypothetical protein [Chitinophagaceae bacterium]